MLPNHLIVLHSMNSSEGWSLRITNSVLKGPIEVHNLIASNGTFAVIVGSLCEVHSLNTLQFKAADQDETDRDSNKMQSDLKGLLFYKKTFVIGVYYFCELKRLQRFLIQSGLLTADCESL